MKVRMGGCFRLDTFGYGIIRYNYSKAEENKSSL